MTDASDLLIHPAAVLLIRYRSLIRYAFHGAAAYGVAIGIATVFGGDARFGGPSYDNAVAIAETVGASPSVLWGVSVAVFGLLGLVPMRKVALWGLYGVAVWSAVFALGFGISVNQEPLAGVSGVFAHAFIALVMTGLITIRMVDRGV